MEQREFVRSAAEEFGTVLQLAGTSDPHDAVAGIRQLFAFRCVRIIAGENGSLGNGLERTLVDVVIGVHAVAVLVHCHICNEILVGLFHAVFAFVCTVVERGVKLDLVLSGTGDRRAEDRVTGIFSGGEHRRIAVVFVIVNRAEAVRHIVRGERALTAVIGFLFRSPVSVVAGGDAGEVNAVSFFIVAERIVLYHNGAEAVGSAAGDIHSCRNDHVAGGNFFCRDEIPFRYETQLIGQGVGGAGCLKRVGFGCRRIKDSAFFQCRFFCRSGKSQRLRQHQCCREYRCTDQ